MCTHDAISRTAQSTNPDDSDDDGYDYDYKDDIDQQQLVCLWELIRRIR